MTPAATESAATSFGLSSIGQVAVTIADLERAVAFYRDSLGMKLLFQVPGLAFFDCAGIRLMLTRAEKPANNRARSFTSKSRIFRPRRKRWRAAACRLRGCRTWWRACRITTCGWLFSATPTATCWRS